ncbi:Anaerobic C4-dicarboxylate transporter DcuA [Sinobacterium norvegicum]|uniref:C4-dicarboxylate transporter n=1 Tax=Sinobacterium norvegicum TaxID=1641715 RepID=A0ABM9AIF1_9GAMM|nr:anaerobic C4-dicarboxylate transporter [Sinobacterium norvegicum]CAH0992551.1 Anaerobic C4-dicarboxylate transporter DcuA [Sinobacterium norvegicum]
MFFLQLCIVLFFIWAGARLGGIGIGLMGAAGVLVLTWGMGLPAGSIPVDVILIIATVITCIGVLQIAGGLDWLIVRAERLLRNNPKHINIIGPVITYLLTLGAGTGMTAFSVLPVIADVAKSQDIKPTSALALSAVASQVAITASPISAAVVFFSGILEPLGVSYLELLAIVIPSSLGAVILISVIVNMLPSKPLSQDEGYQQRVKDGLVEDYKAEKITVADGAGRAVGIFMLAVATIITYASAISDKIGLITNPPLSRDEAIMAIMLTAAGIIMMLSKVEPEKVISASTFKSGMTAIICIIGVAWLGSTFIAAHIDTIKESSGALLQSHSWLLAVALFGASMLLYSQASTTKVLMPAALAIGVSPLAAIAAFPCVSALFVLPTYPTLIASCQFDTTGCTKVGNYVFDHPFILPGTAILVTAVIFGYGMGGIVLG